MDKEHFKKLLRKTEGIECFLNIFICSFTKQSYKSDNLLEM